MINDHECEDKIISLTLKTIALAGDQFEKISMYCLLASGAIAGTIISNIESILKIINFLDIKYCLMFIFASCVSGCASLYLSTLRKQDLNVSINLKKDLEIPIKEKIEKGTPKSELDIHYIVDETYKNLPITTKISYLYIKYIKLKRAPSRDFQVSASQSCLQMSFCAA